MYRHRTRAIGVTLVASVGLGLSACSTDDRPSAGSGQTITLGTDDTERIEPVIDAFEEANPDVTVEIQSGGNSYQEFLRTRLASNSAPDVLRTFPGAGNVAGVISLDESGSLADLSQQSWTDQLSEQQRNLFATSDDRVLSVPVGALALGAVYNTSALDEIGASIPTTYSEVLQLCQTAADNGKFAFAIHQKGGGFVPSFAMAAPLVYGPNPQFTQDQLDGTATFSNSSWTDVFAIQLEMLEAGCFQEGPNGTDWNAAAALVASGDATATLTFSDTTALDQLASDTSFEIAPFPVTDDPADRDLAVADSNGFGVNVNSENKDLAMDFIEFIGSEEGQNVFATAAKGVPALPNDSFEPSSVNQETIIEYQTSGKVAAWPDQEWPGPEIAQAADLVIQGLVDGSVSPSDAVKQLDEAWDKSVANADR